MSRVLQQTPVGLLGASLRAETQRPPLELSDPTMSPFCIQVTLSAHRLMLVTPRTDQPRAYWNWNLQKAPMKQAHEKGSFSALARGAAQLPAGTVVIYRTSTITLSTKKTKYICFSTNTWLSSLHLN